MGESETKVKQPGALKSFLAGGAGGICLVSRLDANLPFSCRHAHVGSAPFNAIYRGPA
jgi:hypothetical protein